MRDTSFKRRLVRQASIQGGQRVLDLGCGTATLTLLIKRMHPEAEVVGLDGDPRAIRIAQAKMAKARLSVALNLGMAFDLPYPDGSFDHVLSSLVFHHLTRMDKERTFQEVSRVLRPGGGLHIA
ncbi:MAG: class I SAM-dependent methyltransferase, partial [Dehalococcoidia bacterium]|nr:class I SAM-dependent methyltransferase [Dehalococcoidia bacterium]